MATVNKEIADQIIAGLHPEKQVVKIGVTHNLYGTTDNYGLVHEGQPSDLYKPSQVVLNSETYWQKN